MLRFRKINAIIEGVKSEVVVCNDLYSSWWAYVGGDMVYLSYDYLYEDEEMIDGPEAVFSSGVINGIDDLKEFMSNFNNKTQNNEPRD